MVELVVVAPEIGISWQRYYVRSHGAGLLAVSMNSALILPGRPWSGVGLGFDTLAAAGVVHCDLSTEASQHDPDLLSGVYLGRVAGFVVRSKDAVSSFGRSVT